MTTTNSPTPNSTRRVGRDVAKLKEAFETVRPSKLEVFRLRGERSYDDISVGIIVDGKAYKWIPSGQAVCGPQLASNGGGYFTYTARLFSLYQLNGRTYAIANLLCNGKPAAYEVGGVKEGFFIE